MGHLCHWYFASKRYREKVSSPSESVCTPVCTPETSPCELRGRGLDTNADGLCDKVATTAARTRTATDDADMPTDDFIILFDLKCVTTTRVLFSCLFLTKYVVMISVHHALRLVASMCTIDSDRITALHTFRN